MYCDRSFRRIAKEVQNLSQKDVLELGELTPFTCPECQGALVRIAEDKLSRFRCHTGHGFTEDALLEGIMQTAGENIWQTTRGLQEAEMLLEHMGRHIREAGDSDRAEKFFNKARQLGKRASRFREIAHDHESLSESNLEQSEK